MFFIVIVISLLFLVNSILFIITSGVFVNSSYALNCKTEDIILQNTKVEIISNPSIKKYTLIDLNRDFYISTPSCIKLNLPIILLFHGGGEVPWNEEGTGIMNYTGLWKTKSICIAFQGQSSNNGLSWENSFPWLKNNPKNDINFVQTVLQRLKNSPFSKYCNFNRIYASGKSDGAGFCFYLLEYAFIDVKKIAICSSANFTLDSVTNTRFLSNKILSVPILAIHGTGDTVMPYNGQHFLNKDATEKAEYWKKIDPTLENTYTFKILYLWNYIGNLFDNNANPVITYISNNSNLYNWGSVKLITATNQNHCWMGHTKSGPDSDEFSNKDFDATTLICKFFDDIKLINYSNSVKTPNIMFQSIT
jgi:poly(3-hydroxybutyrate) depolymerase